MCGERGAGDGEPLLVPAAAARAPLQPAKLAVWRLHAEQVCQKGPVRLSTTCRLSFVSISLAYHQQRQKHCMRTAECEVCDGKDVTAKM